jgi:PKD repeat protein
MIDKRKFIMLLLIVFILISSAIAGCTSEDDEDNEGTEPPIATIVNATPSEGKVPLTVSFEGEGIDNDGSIESYYWDFNDGETSTDQNPTHTFQDPGYYKVLFTVTDNAGATADDDVYINAYYLENFKPKATASANTTRILKGGQVTFTGTGTDQDGWIILYEWDFDGDGVYDWNSDIYGNTTHTFNTPGIYDAEFRVTDNSQATDTDTVTITVDSLGNKYPVAKILEPDDSDSFEVGELVECDGTGSSDPEGVNLTYSWSFGDGTTGYGATTSHSYNNEGSYTIKLRVSDGELDAEDKVTITIHALPPQNNPPEAVIVEPTDGSSFEVGESVYFDGTGSSDPDGDTLAYIWDFGDSITATGEATSHIYSESGTYTVLLTVNDGEFDDTDTVDIFIAPPGGTNQPPQAVIVSPENGDRYQINDTVFYSGNESSDPDDDILNFTWSFGDGKIGYGVTTYHKYTQNGTYTVVLFVNDTQLEDSDSVVIVIGSGSVPNTPPTAVISSPQMGQSFDVGDTVYCNGSDSFDLETASDDLEYQWNFGDSTPNSTSADTTHIYLEEGTYLIFLTVSDGELEDTSSVIITVTAPPGDNSPPTARIAEPSGGSNHAVNENITFDGSDSSDPDDDTLTYKWYFGDGTTGTGVTTQHSYSVPGIYLVTLEVSDGEFNDTDVVTVIITNFGSRSGNNEEEPSTLKTNQFVTDIAIDTYRGHITDIMFFNRR